MKIKKIIVSALVLALAFSFTACGGGEAKAAPDTKTEDKKVVLHVGATVSTTHAWYKAAQQMKDEIYEKSNGSIELVLDFAGVHGGDREITEAVQNGTLGMAICADIGFTQVVTDAGYVNLPYLFPTLEDVDKNYYNGWIGEAVKGSMEKKGLEVLGFTDSDFRYITNSKHPIQKPEDLKNLKLRVPPNPMYVKFFAELGAQPTAMSIGEVASALQQKAIDGQDNGPIITYTFGFQQFQPYLTRTNHAFAGAAFFTGKTTMDQLSPNQQKLMRELGEKYSAVATELIRQDTAKYEEEMAATTQILDNTPELDAAFKEAAKKVWNDTEITKAFDQEVMKKLLSQQQ
ncbi:TRAP transporter substrate-binding protein [Clostridium aminobutyricum]|nr:TRAP transporter substrate-binding protein [Clostridium aminobutyricum]